MELVLDQALFGYERGHRMISSSVEPDKDSARVLRSVTDMRFGGASRSHLTVLPLPRMECHAFIRSWPAGPTLRPGSVWSHVLFMQHTDLDRIETTRILPGHFARPAAEAETDLDELRFAYRSPLRLTPSPNLRHRDDETVTTRSLDRLVTAAYGSATPREIVVSVAQDLDDCIFGLMDQQWPELRRTFTARTRFRGSTSTVAEFLLNVVERPSGRTPTVKARSQRWVTALANDLDSPNAGLRRWLRRYGPETPRGREDVPALVSVVTAAEEGRVAATADLVAKRFPEPVVMPLLKEALYARQSRSGERFGLWPIDEPGRLAALLRVPPNAIDYAELDVPHRLVAHASDARVVGLIPWETLPTVTYGLIVSALTRDLASETLVAIALSNERATYDLLIGRPDSWTEPTLWTSSHDRMALDLIRHAAGSIQEQILRELVQTGRTAHAIAVADIDPTLWWGLFADSDGGAPVGTKSSSAVARAVLTHLGVDKVGLPVAPLTTDNQLLALNDTTTPDLRLWTHVSPELWVGLAQRLLTLPSESIPEGDRLTQIWITALAAGEGSRNSDVRGRAWDAVYAPLHERLAHSAPSDGASETLDSVLPSGSDWDWCARLRQGLAKTAVDDEWSMEYLDAIANRVEEYADDVIKRVSELQARKRRTFFDDLLDIFRI